MDKVSNCMMKAKQITIHTQPGSKMHIKKIVQHHFTAPFHFHNLCELNYVTGGYGKRIVGDRVELFSPGDLVLLSPNLPHIWHNDHAVISGKNNQAASSIVLYFSTDFPESLLDDHAMIEKTRDLLARSARGIRFFGNTQESAAVIMRSIPLQPGYLRTIKFLELMHLLVYSEEYELLASAAYRHAFNERDTERMNNIYRYIMEHFTEPISLAEIASVAYLTPPAFCAFFKRTTQKTFIVFLNELRIGHACRLLQNPELSVSEVCFRSGFQNHGNFNNFFRSVTGKTPREYRKEFLATSS